MNKFTALIAAAVVAATLTGCNTTPNTEPAEVFDGYKVGRMCSDVYKELVNQNYCEQQERSGV